MQAERRPAQLSNSDYIHAAGMAVAGLVSYWATTYGLSRFVGHDDDLLGGMWAVIATVFVYRDSRTDSFSAGIARLIATTVSFALCLPYLWVFGFTPLGMVVLLGLGSVIMALLGRRDDIITTGITTTVVMVVAAISPLNAWQQPVLRLIDTVVGIGIGVAFRWIGSSLYCRLYSKTRP
jgi:uncharacterized membrane protein YgaE (UPF0421/DUF939 family)